MVDTTTFTISLPTELYNALVAKARTEHHTLSDVIACSALVYLQTSSIEVQRFTDATLIIDGSQAVSLEKLIDKHRII